MWVSSFKDKIGVQVNQRCTSVKIGASTINCMNKKEAKQKARFRKIF